jgi:hypothetical protein
MVLGDVGTANDVDVLRVDRDFRNSAARYGCSALHIDGEDSPSSRRISA